MTKGWGAPSRLAGPGRALRPHARVKLGHQVWAGAAGIWGRWGFQSRQEVVGEVSWAVSGPLDIC